MNDREIAPGTVCTTCSIGETDIFIPMLPERYPGHELGVAAFSSGDGLIWSRMGARPVMDGNQ